MTRPIRPDEVGARKVDAMPAAVFEAFNELIARYFAGGVAQIRQAEIEDLIWEKLKPDQDRLGLTARRMIAERGWLNVEEAYSSVGWKVEYDKPGYNENYSAQFIFRK